tara:strand:- start:89 stop:310 length:222 start_codon:yes stop_codon:yes gene_type:complete
MRDETIYHIYVKNECVYPCLDEKEFNMKWTQLKGMVGLMKTDYKEEDITFEKLSAEKRSGVGSSYDDNLEPSY